MYYIKKTISIDSLGMSIRATRALHDAGIHTLEDLMELKTENLWRNKNFSLGTIEEISKKIKVYRQSGSPIMPESAARAKVDAVEQPEDFESWLAKKENQAKVITYLRKAEIGIDALDVLSVKAYNLLLFGGYTKLHQIIFLGNNINNISRMDIATAREIQKACRSYLREHKEIILEAVEEEKTAEEEKPKLQEKPAAQEQSEPKEHPENQKSQKNTEKTEAQLSIYDMMKLPAYQEPIFYYVRMNDVDLARMKLSKKLLAQLYAENYQYLSDIIEKMDLSGIAMMGVEYVTEILGKINDYINSNQDRILAYINGNRSALMGEDSVRECILKLYRNMGFKGLHLPEIIEKLSLPEEVDTDTVKKTIGSLIAEGELEYIDYLVYRVYPSFSSYLKKCDEDNDRGIRCVRLKMQGMTVGSIGREVRLSGARVSQIIRETDAQIRARYLSETGMNCYDEDYYKHLYTDYAVDREVCTEWLGIPTETYNYLDIFNTRGKRDVAEALDDSDLDVGLKLKIRNYLNRNKLFVDGYWLEKKRTDLEEYVLMKYCEDEVTFDSFVAIYNDFLAKQGIPYTEDLYYKTDNPTSRINELADSKVVLWKKHRRLRYYDIAARDYSELLDILNLDAYENTEISTLKFIEDYPELMARYDIRDQFELHNLLRKIVPDGNYHDFHCGKTPIICFGRFDPADTLLDLLISNAPISKPDLVNLIYDEYGYDRATITHFLKSIDDYNHRGMYIIDFKMMTSTDRTALTKVLTEDFYYIDEIKRIYTEMLSGADPEAVNPYNLKSMGFTVLSKYVLRNWTSLEEYFKHFLLADDIVDITPLKVRFSHVQSWSLTLTALKNKYEIIEFEPGHIISIHKLEKAGITKQMLRDFCDQVYQFVEADSYFTAQSLRKSGFTAELYDLGFEDCFYANVLCADLRFSYGNMFGNIVFYKGNKSISVKSFLINQVKCAGKIDIFDLINDLSTDYGCNVDQKGTIMQRLQGSEVYYDPILERLYASVELYYRELDEDPENMVI